MPATPSIASKTVVGKYTAPNGSPVAGKLRFIPTETVYDVTGNVIIPPLPIVVDLDVDGAFVVELSVTDDPDATPTNWAWQLTELIPQLRTLVFMLPSDSPSTVQIASLLPASESGSYFEYASNATVQSLLARMNSLELDAGFEQTETFYFSGTWTCPENVTSLAAEIIGGGGGGGHGGNGGSGSPPGAGFIEGNGVAPSPVFGGGGGDGGSGGGAGARLAPAGVSVTPGNAYVITVGSAGLSASPGGNSAAFGFTAAGGAAGSTGTNGDANGNPEATAGRPGASPSGGASGRAGRRNLGPLAGANGGTGGAAGGSTTGAGGGTSAASDSLAPGGGAGGGGGGMGSAASNTGKSGGAGVRGDGGSAGVGNAGGIGGVAGSSASSSVTSPNGANGAAGANGEAANHLGGGGHGGGGAAGGGNAYSGTPGLGGAGGRGGKGGAGIVRITYGREATGGIGGGNKGEPNGLAGLDSRAKLAGDADPTRVLVGAHFPGYTDTTTTTGNDTTLSDLQGLEGDLGIAPLDFAHVYTGIASGGSGTFSDFNWAKITQYLNVGRDVLVNVALGTHAQINAGDFDDGVTQLCTRFADYIEANPTCTSNLMVEILHEGNATVSYDWAIENSTNLAAASGSVATSLANYLTAFRRIASIIHTQGLIGGRRRLDVVWETAYTSSSGLWGYSARQYYPGASYVDIVAVNAYNRVGISSGHGYYASFSSLVRSWLQQVDQFAGDKPLMIGEVSSTPGGYVTGVTVTSGGSGYSTAPTVQILGGGGTQATATASVSGGVVTGVTVNFRGQDYKSATVSFSGGGGTGATATVQIAATNFSKAQWFEEFCSDVELASRIRWVGLFLENKTSSSADPRLWAPNTLAERAALGRGVNRLRSRTPEFDPLSGLAMLPEIHPDPECANLGLWTPAGSNAGTLNRSLSAANLPGEYDSVIRGVIRLQHNGTAGLPETNRAYVTVPQALITPNQNVTIMVLAKYNYTGSFGGGGLARLKATLENGAGSLGRVSSESWALSDQYRWYPFTTSYSAASGDWRVSLCIGSSTMQGELCVARVSVKYGTHPTPIRPAMRQVTRTTSSDADYTFAPASGGTSTEVLAFTGALTANRNANLPDVTGQMPGRVITVKDETGDCTATRKIILAASGSQTIDEAATEAITEPFGWRTIYHDGAMWRIIARSYTIPDLTSPETVNTVAAAGTTETLPAAGTATIHRVTLNSSSCAITLPAVVAGASFLLDLVQDGTGGRLATWVGSVAWVGTGGTAPTLTTTANKRDLLSFVADDSSTWLATHAGSTG